MTYRTITALLVAAALPVAAMAQTAGLGANAGATVDAAGVGAHANASTTVTLSAQQITTAKARADKEIDRRIASLNALLARVGQMARVTDQFKAQLNTTIQTEITNLTNLKTKIDADTDGSTLKADVQSIATDYRIYRLVLPVSAIAAAADRTVNVATMESALGAKLKARIDAAGSAGADVVALNAALADLASTTAAAVEQAQVAVSSSVSLQADQGDKAVEQSNTAALQAAHKDLQAAQQLLVAARKDIGTILQGLKGLGINANANASSSVQTH